MVTGDNPRASERVWLMAARDVAGDIADLLGVGLGF